MTESGFELLKVFLVFSERNFLTNCVNECVILFG